jgi:hypothetical protein
METNLNQPLPEINNHTQAEFYRYVDLLTMARDQGVALHNETNVKLDGFGSNVICVSFLVSKFKEWEKKFVSSQKGAIKKGESFGEYWEIIVNGVSTPEIIDLTRWALKNVPSEIELPIRETPKEKKQESPRIKKAFNPKIAMSLTKAWRLDPRWEKLFPCTKELFFRLVFRTYRKETFKKIKEAIGRGETYFPYCCTGNNSLSKQLVYHKKSTTKEKHYERRQIGRAMSQLCDLGFIHQIFRGYHDQGAGKYHIFLNPDMSATFHRSRRKIQKGVTQKKPHPRMT